MKKITRDFEVEYPLDWRYNVTIEQIRKDLEELEKLGATYIEFDLYEDHGDPALDIRAMEERLETDEEYQNRLAVHNRKKEYEKHWELEELKRLKEKYGL